MFSEEIKKSLLKTHKNTNEATLDIYIKNASNLLRDVFGKDLNKEKNLNWIKETDKIEKYFDKMKRSISTRRNYYNALLEIGISMNHPVKPIKEIRDKYAQEYNDIEDGLKSKKQEENFCSAEIINEKIDEYEKLIKKGTFSVKIKQDEGRAAVFLNILQIWMILKLLRELNFRGEEIATLEFVKDYQPGSKKNMVFTGNDPVGGNGWFISKNKYKTAKKYGELIIPLQGEILRDLKFYHKKVGDGLLFKTARGLPMSSNTLTKYLLNWSNEFLPPVVLEDGSKRLRNCSVNMIVKIFQSDKYGEIKRKQLEESKNRGNDTTTMNKHYVSTKKPTGFY